LDTTSQRQQSERTGAAAGKGAERGLLAWLVARGLMPETSPKRAFAAATFINQLGRGLFIAGAALFFTRSVGLPVAQVGFALGTGARGPLTRALGAPNPTRYRSYLRALNDIAVGCGAFAAGVVVQLDTRTAYVCLILGSAVSLLVSAALSSRIPSVPPVEVPAGGSRWQALKDRPYVVLTALDANRPRTRRPQPRHHETSMIVSQVGSERSRGHGFGSMAPNSAPVGATRTWAPVGQGRPSRVGSGR
jgi:hypothetical protein